jgi:ABC-2 type transport system permease protein
MTGAFRAEWTKLWTTPGPAWLLVVTTVGTAALGTGICATVACPPGGCDLARLVLSGVYLGQAPIAVLGVRAVSGEYCTGLLRTTLTAVPRRPAVLAAKALVLTLPVAAAGAVGLLVPAITGPRRLSLTDGPALRATAGSVAYLVLIAILGLGVAAIVRDSAAAIGAVLGLLYLPPILIPAVADPRLHRLLEQAAPMTAGLAVQATTDRPPIGPWAGLGVLAAWSAGVLLAGIVLLRRRDA